MIKQLLQRMIDLLDGKSSEISDEYWKCFEKLIQAHDKVLDQELKKAFDEDLRNLND